MVRHCTYCKGARALSEFATSSRSPDGLTQACAACRARRAEIQRKSYLAHRDRRIAETVEWRKANAERVLLYDREYYERNRERKLELSREKRRKAKAARKTAADRITPSYVANVWKTPLSELPPSLVEDQQAYLRLRRAIKGAADNIAGRRG